MRTSLRVFTAAVASLLVVGFLTIVPFARPSAAVSGIHQVTVIGAAVDEGNAGTKNITAKVHLNVQNFVPTVAIEGDVQLANGTARDGQDFTAMTKHFSFPGGQFVSQPDITLTFENAIKGDTFAEPDETIELLVKNLQQADFGGSSPATIKNDDAAPAAFKITKSPDAPEGNGSNIRIVKVELTKNADQDTTLNWATADASATTDPNKGAKDYTPAEGMLTWHAGEKQAQEINVVVNGDTIPEPDEIFGVNFGAPNNAQLNDANSIVKLTNDDGTDIPVFDIAPIPDKTEGDSGATAQTVTVTLTSNAQQNTAVDWILVDGTAKASTQDAKGDFEQDPDVSHHTLIFTKGTTSRTIDVPVNGDTANEPDEGYAV